MELHTRVAMIDTLLEEAEQKRTALTHALHAHTLAEQGKGAPHSAPAQRPPPQWRRRAYSTNTISGRESRPGWPSCARPWTSLSTWNSNGVSASSGAGIVNMQEGGSLWNHANGPTWSTNSCRKPTR
jgi:hypothetical protein